MLPIRGRAISAGRGLGMGERDEDGEWEDDRPRRRPRRRKGPLRRIFTLVKLALFLTPLGLFLFGSSIFDCRARPSFADWTSMIGASACARNGMMGNATMAGDNLAILRRFID
ncbi:hypothetical protein ACFQE0_06265 [Methylobacterium komagatae]|uniref:Uncharacterized protein n=1 Tax=Methylobacterium komagatae TaxID=374425 RepID=A0ABW2BIP6_9HYPH